MLIGLKFHSRILSGSSATLPRSIAMLLAIKANTGGGHPSHSPLQIEAPVVGKRHTSAMEPGRRWAGYVVDIHMDNVSGFLMCSWDDFPSLTHLNGGVRFFCCPSVVCS